MEYISTKEASAKWGITPTRITILANEGRIPGAQKVGHNWLIPAVAVKPVELKGGRGHAIKAETDDFSFPLYIFRPDWIKLNEEALSPLQLTLMQAEIAVEECRFEDAYALLETISDEPKDVATEIGCLWATALCCIALNKPEMFSRAYLRLQLLLSEDFPHRNDLIIVLDYLNSYSDTLYSVSDAHINTDIHEQVIPITCMSMGYKLFTKELMKPGSTETSLLELNLRLLTSSGNLLVLEYLHFFLSVIYFLRHQMENALEHARAMIQIAYDNRLYLPLITFLQYNIAPLSSILEEYPEEFQIFCCEMSAQFEKNYNDLSATLSENYVISKLAGEDYAYALGVLMDLSCTEIGKRTGVTAPTVTRKINKLCEKLGVGNKKELKAYLQKYL